MGMVVAEVAGVAVGYWMITEEVDIGIPIGGIHRTMVG